MKLCLSIEIQEGLSYAQTLALTQAAESLNFESALLAEHYLPSGVASQYTEDPISADAWIYLAGLSRETRSIRLGTLVSPVTFRHPVVLAKMAATLDHLSNGRAELGIGAGWLESEHSMFGFSFPAPARRVDLVQEQLEVINGLWSTDPFTYTGQHYQVQAAHFTPKPVQQPRPTIIVGGRTTSQRLPRLAGRYADEFVIGQPHPRLFATRARCWTPPARLPGAILPALHSPRLCPSASGPAAPKWTRKWSAIGRPTRSTCA